ncbi:hypothetical protein DM860_015554 [Cuscuta australis]|uniref:cytokinin riboside 5'-monophosphate phosphoribohydrolase n=1 Tax=Cuscuta australis TaxID=267555 RepID=A0A328DKL2_9ASTE|nr:hypothetical protein DM860_015554 [Cuscuta australis]
MEGTSRTFPYTIKFVGLLGSHSLGRNPKFMATAVDLGRELVRQKTILTYGRGNVGLQGVVASTVYTNGGIVRGFIPGYIAARQVYGPTYGAEYTVSSNYYKYFEMNHVMEAFIVLPGGIDTMEGLSTLISWASEGLHSKPIGLLNIDGYFNNLIKFLDDAVVVPKCAGRLSHGSGLAIYPAMVDFTHAWESDPGIPESFHPAMGDITHRWKLYPSMGTQRWEGLTIDGKA